MTHKTILGFSDKDIEETIRSRYHVDVDVSEEKLEEIYLHIKRTVAIDSQMMRSYSHFYNWSIYEAMRDEIDEKRAAKKNETAIV